MQLEEIQNDFRVDAEVSFSLKLTLSLGEERVTWDDAEEELLLSSLILDLNGFCF